MCDLYLSEDIDGPEGNVIYVEDEMREKLNKYIQWWSWFLKLGNRVLSRE